jgi:hypothetical protein
MLLALEVAVMRHAAAASSFLCLAATGLLTGCPDRSISEVEPQQGRVEFKDIPVNVNRDVDILFVIDDSPSMADKQNNLAANFPRFIEVLSRIPGGLPNVHIGVVTSDYGTTDATGAVAADVGRIGFGGCSGPGKAGDLRLGDPPPVTGGNFISDILQPDGITRVKNYTGTLDAAFAVMAKAGAGGCGFEQHLEAMKQALDGNPVNAGFIRDNAFLAVIFIADEDDCSMSNSAALLGADEAVLGPRQSFRCTRFGIVCDEGGATPDAMNQVGTKTRCHPAESSEYLAKVSEYVAFLKGLKADPNKVIVAGIMGTITPFAVELRALPTGGDPIPSLAHSCQYIGGDRTGDGVGDLEVADPPIRLQFFMDQFPNRSTFSSICQQDLSGGLQQIADLLKTVIGNPCVEGKLADVDPVTDGAQYDCSVSAVTNINTPQQAETILPKCTPEDATATNQPCWHLETDAMSCPTSDNFKLVIEGEDTLVQDTHIISNCVTEVTIN